MSAQPGITAYQKRVESGLCVQSCGYPARPGKTLCIYCARKITDRNSAAYPCKHIMRCSFCRKTGHARPRCMALTNVFAVPSNA